MLVKQLVNKQRGVKLISGRILDIPPASVGNDFWLPWIFALVSVSLLKWAFFVSQLWLVSRVWGKGREEQMWLREETQRLVAGRRREEGKGVAWMGSIWKRRCLHIYFPLSFFFFFRAKPTSELLPNPSHVEIMRWFLQNHVPGTEMIDCAGLCLVLHSRLSALSSPNKSCSWGETETLCRGGLGVSTEKKKGRQPNTIINNPELPGHSPCCFSEKKIKIKRRRIGSVTSSAVF